MIVSSFEVLLQPIGPGASFGAADLKKAPDVTPDDAPKAGEVLRSHFVPPQLTASGLPFVVPTALQGYFLYLSNPDSLPTSSLEVAFISEDPKVMAAQVPTTSGTPAFLAITNTQPPLLDGNTTTSGIDFGGLTASGIAAYTVVPSIEPFGTTLLGVIPNYLNPSLVNSGPVARGYVGIRTTDGSSTSLIVSAQTRVVFFEPGNSGSGMDTSEAAYSMPSSTGGSLFTFSGI